jgi:nitrogen fixation protein FixH
MNPDPARIRRFTGWHMAMILMAFFAVVIGVNLVMATVAVRSFGGAVVENSYVASQKFNGWLAQARVQRELGWKEEVKLDGRRRLRLAIADDAGRPLRGSEVNAVAQHPLGRAPDILLRFREAEAGLYASEAALPAGRWNVRVDVRQGAAEHHLLKEIE